jgi:DNA-binding transcriptional LysR family regulator
MNDRLSALRVFVRVARLGSFSAGGRDLSMPQPTVSRMISHLERDLGAALFRRSPAYLKKAGRLSTPSDLAAHAVIAAPSRMARSWSFTRNGKAVSVAVQGRLMTTMKEVATVAAVAGLGLVSMTLGACRKEFEEGSLVRVLPEWDMGAIDVHAVFPTAKGIKASARAFTEFLVSEFATDPYFLKHAAVGGKKGPEGKR